MAYLANQADVCESCGHPRSVCRNKKTAGQWQVVEEICQPSVVLEATVDNAVEAGQKRRGVMLGTRRVGG